MGSFGGADADDAAGDHLGRADGHAEKAGGEDDDGGGGFRGKALRGFDFRDGEGHGFDDAETARGGAESHDDGAGEDDPEGDFGSGDVAGGEKAEGDDPHAFLRVVESVREGDEAGRANLEMAEELGVVCVGAEVEGFHEEIREKKADEGTEDHREEDFVEDALP